MGDAPDANLAVVGVRPETVVVPRVLDDRVHLTGEPVVVRGSEVRARRLRRVIPAVVVLPLWTGVGIFARFVDDDLMLARHGEVPVIASVLPILVAHRILHLLKRVDHCVGLASVRVEQAVSVEAGVRGVICSVRNAETTKAAVGVAVLNNSVWFRHVRCERIGALAVRPAVVVTKRTISRVVAVQVPV